VNATYDVTVYATSSGAMVGQVSLNAATTQCPYVAAYREGDTQYVMTLTDNDVTNAVKPYVMPAA
jgi:K+-transporting ATPase c subunit